MKIIFFILVIVFAMGLYYQSKDIVILEKDLVFQQKLCEAYQDSFYLYKRQYKALSIQYKYIQYNFDIFRTKYHEDKNDNR